MNDRQVNELLQLSVMAEIYNDAYLDQLATANSLHRARRLIDKRILFLVNLHRWVHTGGW